MRTFSIRNVQFVFAVDENGVVYGIPDQIRKAFNEIFDGAFGRKDDPHISRTWRKGEKEVGGIPMVKLADLINKVTVLMWQKKCSRFCLVNQWAESASQQYPPSPANPTDTSIPTTPEGVFSLAVASTL